MSGYIPFPQFICHWSHIIKPGYSHSLAGKALHVQTHLNWSNYLQNLLNWCTILCIGSGRCENVWTACHLWVHHCRLDIEWISECLCQRFALPPTGLIQSVPHLFMIPHLLWLWIKQLVQNKVFRCWVGCTMNKEKKVSYFLVRCSILLLFQSFPVHNKCGLGFWILEFSILAKAILIFKQSPF